MVERSHRADDDPAAEDRATSAKVHEHRAAARVMTVHRTSAIEAGSRQGLCIIKNLSTDGAMIRTSVDLAAGDLLVLVMASGLRIAGSVRWTNADQAGIRFDAPQTLSSILDRGWDVQSSANGRRLPRLNVALPATVADLDGERSVTTRDISTHGARLVSAEPLMIGPISIRLFRLPSIRARILWNIGDEYGCVFTTPFGVDELTRIVSMAE